MSWPKSSDRILVDSIKKTVLMGKNLNLKKICRILNPRALFKFSLLEQWKNIPHLENFFYLKNIINYLKYYKF